MTRFPIYYNSDYHWYRQNSDGTWSHKHGQLPIQNTDDANNPQTLYDPSAADLGTYEFVGFYAVTPWNHMYSESLTSQSTSETTVPKTTEYHNWGDKL